MWPTILEGRGQVHHTFYTQHFRVADLPVCATREEYHNPGIRRCSGLSRTELKANLLKTLPSPFKGLSKAKLSLLTMQSWLPPAGWRQAFLAQPLRLFSAQLFSADFLHFARGLAFPSFPMLLTFTGKHQSDSSEIMLCIIGGMQPCLTVCFEMFYGFTEKRADF